MYSYRVASGMVALVSPAAFSVNTSPAEGRIVVGKLLDGNRELVVFESAGRELARLTNHPAEDFGAAWSPDGKWIAFTSKRNGHSQAFVAAADGSSPRLLIDAGGDRSLNPTWSPDGRLIAYYREKGDGADQIHVVRPDGSGDRNVTNDTFNNIFLGWIPDGRIVYGQGRKDGTTAAFSVQSDGSRKEPLLGIQSFFIRFSPGGDRIAYLTERPGSDDIRIVIADRAGRVQVTVPLDRVGAAP